MSSIIRKYSASVIVVASIVLGFFFPEVGLVWKPYLTLLLMLLMFLVALGIESNEIVHSMRNYQVIVIGLLTVFVLTPALSVLASLFFSPMIYVGTVLAFCCPPAIVTTFWTEVFGGDVAVALVITAVTSLLSIVTIPGTMLLAVGTTVSVDIVGLMTNLGEVILIPMTASFLLRRFVKVDWLRVRDYASRVQLGILVLLIWGSVAAGVEYVSKHRRICFVERFYVLRIGCRVYIDPFSRKEVRVQKGNINRDRSNTEECSSLSGYRNRGIWSVNTSTVDCESYCTESVAHPGESTDKGILNYIVQNLDGSTGLMVQRVG